MGDENRETLENLLDDSKKSFARQEEKIEELIKLTQTQEKEIGELRYLIRSEFRRLHNDIDYVLLRLSVKERIKERIAKVRHRIMPVEKDVDFPPTSSRKEEDDQTVEDKTLIEMIKKIESLPLEVYIATNWECNYNCTYCFSYKPTNKSEYRKHTAVEWEDALYSLYKRYGKCRVTLTGGDPLLYKDAVGLVINATKYHYVSVGTNLSIEKDALARIARESNLGNLFISSSYHLEHSLIDTFMNKVVLLKSYGVGVYSSAVAYPEFIAEMPKIRNAFEKRGLGIAFFPYMGMYKGRTFPSEYSTEELSVLKELPGWHLTINNSPNGKIQLPRSKGVFCYTGSKFIFVSPEGEVRRCVKVYQSLGNIFDNAFSLLKNPEPCPLEVCDCEVSGGDCVLPFTVEFFTRHQRFRLNQIR